MAIPLIDVLIINDASERKKVAKELEKKKSH